MVTWAPDPILPGPIDGSKLTVSSAQFMIHRFQVIGDAGPGDPRTTRSAFWLQWDATHAAEPIVFDAAPPGLYSLISLDLGNDDEMAYEISGTVEVNGANKPFHVADDEGLRISLPCAANHKETEDTTLEIRLGLDAPLKAVDFSMVPNVAGTLELDSESPQIALFRLELVQAFELGSTSTTTR